ncbi:MAG: methyltransferase domain-containing protein [Fibrobacter sp.]|nr:methyltransferase domain-containing protein [Fibrobacter sp.]
MSGSIQKVITPQKKHIARAFGLKASQYDSYATVQIKILKLLIKQIMQYPDNGLWADFGCGTGILEKLLAETGNSKLITGIDIAVESLTKMMQKVSDGVLPVAADIEHLPFRAECFSGIIISSVLQWFSDPLQILQAMHTKLKPGGTLVFSVFTSKSFLELNQLRTEYGLGIPVRLPPEEKVPELLMECGYKILRIDNFRTVEYFSDARCLLKSLSAIGGTAVTGHRLTRNELNSFCSDFENRYGSTSGVPLTYETIIGTARKET